MSGWVRKRLGVLTTLWLCCQALSLVALARDCCVAHDPAEPVAHGHGHHGLPVAVTSDAVTAHDAHSHDGAPDGTHSPRNADCTMREACSPSAVGLASLIWIPGVLGESAAFARADAQPLQTVSDALTLDLTLDRTLPPPRA